MGGDLAHHTDPGGLGLPTGTQFGELNLRPAGGVRGLSARGPRLIGNLRDLEEKIPRVQDLPITGVPLTVEEESVEMVLAELRSLKLGEEATR